MNTFWLTWTVPIGNASRLQPAPWSSARDTIRAVETALLVTCGVAAACAVVLLEFKWRLPGHAILRAVFPMALDIRHKRMAGGATDVVRIVRSFDD